MLEEVVTVTCKFEVFICLDQFYGRIVYLSHQAISRGYSLEGTVSGLLQHFQVTSFLSL